MSASLVLLGACVAVAVMPRCPARSVVATPTGSSNRPSPAPPPSLARVRPTGSAESVVAALPTALDVAARSGRAGCSLAECIRTAAVKVPAVRWEVVAHRIDTGATLTEALDGWAAALDHADIDFVVALLVLGAEGGAPVAKRLERTASVLRTRAALGDELRVMTAQTRASATVVALSPLAFTVLLALVEPALLARSVSTAVGLASLATGLGLVAVGGWWMRRLGRIEQ